MINEDFYSKLDEELSKIIEENPANKALNQHKDKERNKSYAFLMWFLQFYGQTQAYSKYITDGKGDNSCDIILDVDDVESGKIYYVVQSKWNNKKNCSKLINNTEFKSALDDFKLVMLGEKTKTKNEAFNKKYKELTKHAEQNGKIKFVYFTLANYNTEVEDNIKSFEKNYNTSVEILDINRIKRDYIDFHYKKIIPNNPLENYYSPDEEITLNIEQLGIKKNYLKIDKPFDAYIFLIRPKTIFELFSKYKFKLFFKNVRNPLISSKVNENIEETLKNEIPYFWYFNNGLTALTSYVDDHINPTAKAIKISGLQIINGAQTVYSVYKSYRDASAKDRKIMDKEAILTMRLLMVNSEKLGLKITKFTNSQNPMEERDFWANDDIQVELQRQSFDTKFWYEKRRGEFRERPEGIQSISNRDFAVYHLAFNLQQPNQARLALSENKDYFFISRREDKDGLYEEIFYDNSINFEDMLAAYLFAVTFHPSLVQASNEPIKDIAGTNYLQTVTLSKILLEKFLIWKYKNESISTNKFIINNFDIEKSLFRAIAFNTNILTYRYLGIKGVTSKQIGGNDKFFNFVTNPTKFELVKEYFEELIFTNEMGKAIEEMKTELNLDEEE